MNAGGSVVMQPGSTVNVSGGWIDYQGGMVQTTKLISGGHIYDISQATPNIVYDGILNVFTVDDTKWGVTQTFGNALVGGPYYDPGYIQGGNGGSLSISAPSMALDGNLLANAFAGSRQRTIAPDSGALALLFQAQSTASESYPIFSPTPPNITFQSGVISAAPVSAVCARCVQETHFHSRQPPDGRGPFARPHQRRWLRLALHQRQRRQHHRARQCHALPGARPREHPAQFPTEPPC